MLAFTHGGEGGGGISGGDGISGGGGEGEA
jgi:hypothetical protein